MRRGSPQPKLREDPLGYAQRLAAERHGKCVSRRYLDLFSLRLGAGREIKRKKDGKILKFDRREALVRVPLIANSYINHETVMAANVNKKLGGR